LAVLDKSEVRTRVKDNFATNTAITPEHGSDAWYASCVEYVAYDERDPIMLRGILLPGIVPLGFHQS
jgi:hypothetical protein